MNSLAVRSVGVGTHHIDASEHMHQLQQSDRKLEKVGIIALKVLAVAGVVAGTALAVGGAVVLTKVAAASGVMAPLLALGIIIGTGLLYLVSIAASNPMAAITAALLIPPVLISFGLPFIVPIAVGALPGIGLTGLSIAGLGEIYSYERNRAQLEQ